MSADASTGGGSRPPAEAPPREVHARFRSALLAGDQPRIEDFLSDRSGAGHSALLRGLVTLEVAYRLRKGQAPTVEEYRARFPGQDQAVEDAFRHPALQAAPNRATTATADEGATYRLAPPDVPAPQPQPQPIPAADPDASHRFGDYLLLDRITRNETGVVYRARQLGVDRIVALQLVTIEESASAARIEQFYRETRAVAALDHPGVVPIFDVGQYEDQHFIAMGHVEGETLARRRSGGGLGLRDGVEVVRQVAETLASAHSKGVVHRNLTPKNILLNARGRPRVTGFGSSAPLSSEGSQSLHGRVVGTPGFLAPEQADEDQEVGPAADIHALGAVLYFVLTGQPPFRGANLVETLTKVLHSSPKPPRRLNPAVPEALEAICLKCLQKRPARRYARADELAGDLGRWLRNEPVVAPLEGPILGSTRRVGQLIGRHRRASLGAAGALAAILASVAAFTLLARPSPTRNEGPKPARTAPIETRSPVELAGFAQPARSGANPGAKVGAGAGAGEKAATAQVKVNSVSSTAATPARPNLAAVTKTEPVTTLIPLKGTIEDLAIGGDRYLVMACRDPAQLVIFDAAAGAIAKEIPLASKAYVAAGSRTFIVVYPAQGEFQSWDFATLTMKKQETPLFTSGARIEGIAMGSQSEGPLLVLWDVEVPAHGVINFFVTDQNAFSPSDLRVRAFLIEPDSLSLIKISGFDFEGSRVYRGPRLVRKDERCFVLGPNLTRYPGPSAPRCHVRASARGDLFACSTSNGMALLSLRESKSSQAVYCYPCLGNHWPLCPAPDGRRVFILNSRALRLDASGAVEQDGDLPGRALTPGAKSLVFPTEDPAYFLQFETDHRRPNWNAISVLLPTAQVLLTQSVQSPRNRGKNPDVKNMNFAYLGGKRILLFPKHELLVVIPDGDDRLLLRKVALQEELDRLDQPVVLSPSYLFATRGKTFSHQVRVHSKAGGVTCSIGKGFGPDNLDITPDGKMTWPVPSKLEDHDVTAVITVTDATGKTVSHRLSIFVR